jgi:hypothetical protein
MLRVWLLVFSIAAIIAGTGIVTAQEWSGVRCEGEEPTQCGGAGNLCEGSSCSGCTGNNVSYYCIENYYYSCEGVESPCGQMGTGVCSSGVCISLQADPEDDECCLIECD